MTANRIGFFSADIRHSLRNKTILRRWMERSVAIEGHTVQFVNIILCSDKYLHELNVQYLNHDTYTDIITFDQSEKKGNRLSVAGELYISHERVKENARVFGVPTAQELHRVMIHGILHLMGYKDKSKSQAATMRDKENECLAMLDDLLKAN